MGGRGGGGRQPWQQLQLAQLAPAGRSDSPGLQVKGEAGSIQEAQQRCPQGGSLGLWGHALPDRRGPAPQEGAEGPVQAQAGGGKGQTLQCTGRVAFLKSPPHPALLPPLQRQGSSCVRAQHLIRRLVWPSRWALLFGQFRRPAASTAGDQTPRRPPQLPAGSSCRVKSWDSNPGRLTPEPGPGHLQPTAWAPGEETDQRLTSPRGRGTGAPKGSRTVSAHAHPAAQGGRDVAKACPFNCPSDLSTTGGGAHPPAGDRRRAQH